VRNFNLVSCGNCGRISVPSKVGVTLNDTHRMYFGHACKECKNAGPKSNMWRLINGIDMYLNVKTAEYKRGETT